MRQATLRADPTMSTAHPMQCVEGHLRLISACLAGRHDEQLVVANAEEDSLRLTFVTLRASCVNEGAPALRVGVLPVSSLVVGRTHRAQSTGGPSWSRLDRGP